MEQKQIKTKDEARQYAIEWQYWFSEQNQIGKEPTLYTSDLVEWQNIFTKLGRKFGLLKEFKEADKNIGAICAAPYALHKAEVLNTNYTCYPSFEQKIRENGYHKKDAVVIDDNVITSRGPATAMLFALEIVNILCGEEKYLEIKNGLLLNN